MHKDTLADSSKPLLIDVLDAVSFRLLISEMAEHFAKVKMTGVSAHLVEAYKETDRIWEENDFYTDKISTERPHACNTEKMQEKKTGTR